MFVLIVIGHLIELSLGGGIKFTSTESEEARKWFDLAELGNNITQILTKPSGPGHKFVRDLFVYWENIEYVLNSIKKRETRGMDVYNYLKKQGGPPHTKLEVNDNLLLKSFNWTTRDIKEVHGIINDTDIVWKDISTYINKN
uniref:Uncharacterized protein n=1 Tax=Clastoptera arizonana TaxID=38151 RepID=A0A1B6E214_9HEMI